MSAEAPLPRAYGFRYMRGFEPLLHAIAQAVRSLENVNWISIANQSYSVVANICDGSIPNTSFPRRRESSVVRRKSLDSRLRGNDESNNLVVKIPDR